MTEDKKESLKDGLYNVMVQGFFDKDEVRRFVYVELMTIKTLLIAKGYIDQREFDVVRDKVEKQITDEIMEQIRNMEKSNPREAATLDLFARLFSGPSKQQPPSATDSAAS